MTYNVFSGTLNPTHSLTLAVSVADVKNRMWMHFVDASYDKL